MEKDDAGPIKFCGRPFIFSTALYFSTMINLTSSQNYIKKASTLIARKIDNERTRHQAQAKINKIVKINRQNQV